MSGLGNSDLRPKLQATRRNLIAQGQGLAPEIVRTRSQRELDVAARPNLRLYNPADHKKETRPNSSGPKGVGETATAADIAEWRQKESAKDIPFSADKELDTTASVDNGVTEATDAYAKFRAQNADNDADNLEAVDGAPAEQTVRHMRRLSLSKSRSGKGL